MKRNVFIMNDLELIEFIAEEIETYKEECVRKNSLDTGYHKVTLKELQQYSNLLQRPIVFGVENARELKGTVDSYLTEFEQSNKRNIGKISMQDYYKATREYNQFAK